MIGVSTNVEIGPYSEAIGNPVNPAITPGVGLDLLAPMNFWERLTNTLLSQFFNAAFHLMMRQQDKYVERSFGPGYPSVTELVKDLDLLLVNSHWSLNGIAPVTPALVPVAGLHIKEDNSTLSKVGLRFFF